MILSFMIFIDIPGLDLYYGSGIGRREFGWDRGIGLLEGLREAKRVLEMGSRVVEEDLRKRIVNRVMGFLLGY